ncbi:MAG: SHOCT domain-containing protein [Candidatus Omnitrophota bacterium]
MRSTTVIVAVILFLSVTVLSGCGSFWGGAAVGAVGVGAADVISAKSQMDKLDADYSAGRITKEEYEIRKDQIKKGSIIY